MHTLVCISSCRLTCGGGYLVHVRALAFGLARTQTHTQTHTHTSVHRNDSVTSVRLICWITLGPLRLSSMPCSARLPLVCVYSGRVRRACGGDTTRDRGRRERAGGIIRSCRETVRTWCAHGGTRTQLSSEEIVLAQRCRLRMDSKPLPCRQSRSRRFELGAAITAN